MTNATFGAVRTSLANTKGSEVSALELLAEAALTLEPFVSGAAGAASVVGLGALPVAVALGAAEGTELAAGAAGSAGGVGVLGCGEAIGGGALAAPPPQLDRSPAAVTEASASPQRLLEKLPNILEDIAFSSFFMMRTRYCR